MFQLSRYVFETVLAEISPYLTDSNSRNSEHKFLGERGEGAAQGGWNPGEGRAGAE